MLELTIRLVFSLAAVLGLLMLLARFGSRKFRGSKEALVQIVHRQHLTRGTSVSVVTVGSRVLVLGTTEHQVRVLAELDPEEIAEYVAPEPEAEVVDAGWLDEVDDADAAVLAPAARTATRSRLRPVPRPASQGGLSGSVLSVDTWRQALAVATRRAS